MAIQGLTRLNRKLKRFPDAAREAISAQMEQIASRVVAMAQSLAPSVSGDLRNSIAWTWGDAPKGAIVLGSVKSKRRAGTLAITIYAGNDQAFYARWIEFGTSPHINGGLYEGSEHPGTVAQPFFYPAWRANRKSARSGISRAITKSAKQVASGG